VAAIQGRESVPTVSTALSCNTTRARSRRRAARRVITYLLEEILARRYEIADLASAVVGA